MPGGDFMEILSLGEKIKRRRKMLNLTLKDVAGDYVTPAQLSYIESNKCNPSESLLRYICDKIELDYEYASEDESKQAERLCSQYIEQYDLLIKEGDLSQALDILTKVEKLSLEYKLEKFKGIALYKNGIYYYIKGDDDLAEYNLISALQIFMALDLFEYMAECYYKLGCISIKRGYFENAFCLLTSAFDIYLNRFAEDKEMVCLTALNTAKACFMLEKNDETEKYLLLALKYAESLDAEKKVLFYFNGAALASRIQNSIAAEKIIEEAFKLQSENSYEDKGLFFNIIRALIFIKKEDFKSATDIIEREMKKNEKIDYETADNLIECAKCLMHKGYDCLIEGMLNAVYIMWQHDINIKKKILFLKSVMYIKTDLDEAYNCLNECMDLFDLSNDKADLASNIF